MLRMTLEKLRIAFTLLITLTVLTGIIYPLLVTGLAQWLFPMQANGSLIQQDGTLIGSSLIGQYFNDPTYFWGRPSATSPFPNNAQASSGSNMGPSNPLFLNIVKERAAIHAKFNSKQLVPVDLVTASGSGVDPDISPWAAFYQIPRVAKSRHIPEKDLYDLIQRSIQPRTFGILGEPRVNVLTLNIALDILAPSLRTPSEAHP